ncbi:hypothetical protein TL16_g12295 [Triparma laevis f. inornata]|uniref:Uncharacterized protein n=1 Tax=Triparma laevis f. inornata TaxID=1714386 RepID=A0A9W7BT36_9STRA|nr:hypothetical protein TL16_g12295 [Triparma laevis f. inornata]
MCVKTCRTNATLFQDDNGLGGDDDGVCVSGNDNCYADGEAEECCESNPGPVLNCYQKTDTVGYCRPECPDNVTWLCYNDGSGDDDGGGEELTESPTVAPTMEPTLAPTLESTEAPTEEGDEDDVGDGDGDVEGNIDGGNDNDGSDNDATYPPTFAPTMVPESESDGDDDCVDDPNSELSDFGYTCAELANPNCEDDSEAVAEDLWEEGWYLTTCPVTCGTCNSGGGGDDDNADGTTSSPTTSPTTSPTSPTSSYFYSYSYSYSSSVTVSIAIPVTLELLGTTEASASSPTWISNFKSSIASTLDGVDPANITDIEVTNVYDSDRRSLLARILQTVIGVSVSFTVNKATEVSDSSGAASASAVLFNSVKASLSESVSSGGLTSAMSSNGITVTIESYSEPTGFYLDVDGEDSGEILTLSPTSSPTIASTGYPTSAPTNTPTISPTKSPGSSKTTSGHTQAPTAAVTKKSLFKSLGGFSDLEVAIIFSFIIAFGCCCNICKAARKSRRKGEDWKLNDLKKRAKVKMKGAVGKQGNAPKGAKVYVE